MGETAPVSSRDARVPARRSRTPAARAIVIGLELLALVIGVALAVVAFAAWRLSQGPVDLAPIAPTIERLASRAGARVAIGAAEARWLGDERLVRIEARDIAITDAGGRSLGVTRRLVLIAPPLGLAVGRPAIRRVEAEGGLLHVAVDARGDLAVGLGPAPAVALQPPDADRRARLQRAVQRLIDRPPPPAGFVVALSDVRLDVVDTATGLAWRAEGLQAAYRRTRDGLVLQADGVIRGEGLDGAVAIRLRGDPAKGPLSIEAGGQGLSPARLAPSDIAGPLAGLDAPLRLTLIAELGPGRRLLSAVAAAASGPGVWRSGDIRQPVQAAAVEARYDPAADRLVISDASISAGPFAVAGSGALGNVAALWTQGATGLDLTLSRLDAPPLGPGLAPIRLTQGRFIGSYDAAERRLMAKTAGAVLFGARAGAQGELTFETDRDGRLRPLGELNLTTDATTLTVPQVLSVWPRVLAPNTRAWVAQNILGGLVSDGRARLVFTPEVWARGRFPKDGFSLTFRAVDARVRTAEGLSPVTRAAGTVAITGDSLLVTATTGELAGLRLSGGAVRIDRFIDGQPVVIAATARGGVREAGALLDQPALRIFTKAGVPVASLSGQAEAQITLTRATGEANRNRPLEFRVRADLTGAGLRDAFAGLDLTAADLSLEASNAEVRIQGPARLGGAPLDLVWREDLRSGAEQPTLILARGDATIADLSRFGMAFGEAVTGVVGLDIRATGRGAAIESAMVSADLTRTALKAPDGRWSKPPGAAADLSMRVVRDGPDRWDLRDVRGEGPGIAILGQAQLDKQGRWLTAGFPRFTLAGIADLGFSARREGGVLVIESDGRYFDAAPFLALDGGDGADGGLGPMRLTADIDVLRLRPRADVTGARLSLVAGTDGVQSLRLTGAGGSGPMSLAIASGAGGGRTVRAEFDDAAFAGRVVGMDALVRGKARLEGVMPAAGRRGPSRLDLTMTDFVVRRGATASRVLSEAEFADGPRAVQQGDLSFATLTAPLVLEGQRIEVGRARATGPSLGVTGSGVIDLGARRIAITGVIAPAYAVNSALGALPVVGALLVPREGEGLVGVTYRLDGPIDAPKTTVNPVSALAPGFLRRIFEGRTPTDAGGEPAAATTSPER